MNYCLLALQKSYPSKHDRIDIDPMLKQCSHTLTMLQQKVGLHNPSMFFIMSLCVSCEIQHLDKCTFSPPLEIVVQFSGGSKGGKEGLNPPPLRKNSSPCLGVSLWFGDILSAKQCHICLRLHEKAFGLMQLCEHTEATNNSLSTTCGFSV